jgi:hypothetical protein
MNDTIGMTNSGNLGDSRIRRSASVGTFDDLEELLERRYAKDWPNYVLISPSDENVFEKAWPEAVMGKDGTVYYSLRMLSSR